MAHMIAKTGNLGAIYYAGIGKPRYLASLIYKKQPGIPVTSRPLSLTKGWLSLIYKKHPVYNWTRLLPNFSHVLSYRSFKLSTI